MKVAITKVPSGGASCERLSVESIAKLKAALVHATVRERDLTIVLAFDGFYIHDEDFNRIRKELEEDHNVEFLTAMADMCVIRTENMDIITVKMVGGSTLFVAPPVAPKASAPPHPPSAVTSTKKPAAKKAAPSSTNKTPTTKNSRKRQRESPSNDDSMGDLTQECAGLFP